MSRSVTVTVSALADFHHQIDYLIEEGAAMAARDLKSRFDQFMEVLWPTIPPLGENSPGAGFGKSGYPEHGWWFSIDLRTMNL